MTALWNGLLGTWTSLRPWARFAMVAWLVTWVCLPIVKRIWGDLAMRWGVAMAVVLQATAVVFVLEAAWGWGRTILTGTWSRLGRPTAPRYTFRPIGTATCTTTM